jgi:hypothetical protein
MVKAVTTVTEAIAILMLPERQPSETVTFLDSDEA